MIRPRRLGREQQEDEVHRLLVDGVEIDRRFEPREHAEELLEAGQLAVGNGDAVAHARRAQPFALEQHLEDLALGLEPVPGQSGYSRCARATFTATYEVPALTLPWIGGFGEGIDVTSTHSELVDPYRSGVPGSAEACGE